MGDSYRPAEYWASRLEADFSLRGTGHVRYSPAYNRWLYRRKRDVLHRALRGIDLPARALDVGSGTGWVVGELRRWGAEVEGCDIADISVRRLKEMFPDASFFVASVGTDPIPRPADSYDLVTMLDVAYHITDDDTWRRALADLSRVLRPGGRLFVSDGFGLEERCPAAHVRFRSRRLWEEAARESGLRLIGVRPYFRWLSRSKDHGRLASLPDGMRGAVEYALERLVPRSPHLSWAVLERA